MSELYRYIVVGIANTAWGYLLIFTFMYVFGWPPEASNIMGYAIGLVTSYALNRRFTFRSRNTVASEFVRFLTTFGLAFGANFVVLVLLVRVLSVHEAISQIVAGAVYVATSYLLSRHFVFRRLKS